MFQVPRHEPARGACFRTARNKAQGSSGLLLATCSSRVGPARASPAHAARRRQLVVETKCLQQARLQGLHTLGLVSPDISATVAGLKGATRRRSVRTRPGGLKAMDHGHRIGFGSGPALGHCDIVRFDAGPRRRPALASSPPQCLLAAEEKIKTAGRNRETARVERRHFCGCGPEGRTLAICREQRGT